MRRGGAAGPDSHQSAGHLAAGDPHLAFTAPKTAEYIVQVSDASEFGDKDFFQLVRDRLRPGGVVAINVGTPPDLTDAVGDPVELAEGFVSHQHGCIERRPRGPAAPAPGRASEVEIVEIPPR